MPVRLTGLDNNLAICRQCQQRCARVSDPAVIPTEGLPTSETWSQTGDLRSAWVRGQETCAQRPLLAFRKVAIKAV